MLLLCTLERINICLSALWVWRRANYFCGRCRCCCRFLLVVPGSFIFILLHCPKYSITNRYEAHMQVNVTDNEPHKKVLENEKKPTQIETKKENNEQNSCVIFCWLNTHYCRLVLLQHHYTMTMFDVHQCCNTKWIIGWKIDSKYSSKCCEKCITKSKRTNERKTKPPNYALLNDLSEHLPCIDNYSMTYCYRQKCAGCKRNEHT